VFDQSTDGRVDIDYSLSVVKHMNLLRDIQHDTHGLPNSFALDDLSGGADVSPCLVGNLRPGASGMEVVKMHAVARLMLGSSIRIFNLHG